LTIKNRLVKIMQTNNGIRVIKRAERDLRQEQSRVAERPEVANRRKQTMPLDAVATITNWIGELRQKKNAEAQAALAFKGLFTEAA